MDTTAISDYFTRLELYKPVQLDDDAAVRNVYRLLIDANKYDCYCVFCGKESTFESEAFRLTRVIGGIDDTLRTLRMYSPYTKMSRCLRESSHQMIHVFVLNNNTMVKIGQYPSTADIYKDELKKYRVVLKGNESHEFSKAVGLASHGVGIGSFVYLRRIFESLIEEAHTAAKLESGWDEDEYSRSKMVEKVGMLKHHLPEFLVRNKAIYSILSKGIHELSEEECLEFFPVMRASIELILDEKIEKIEKEKKIKDASTSLGAILGKLK